MSVMIILAWIIAPPGAYKIEMGGEKICRDIKNIPKIKDILHLSRPSLRYEKMCINFLTMLLSCYVIKFLNMNTGKYLDIRQLIRAN